VTLPPLTIVGLGAVGTALAHACVEAGVTVAAVASRAPEKAAALAALVGAQAITPAEAGRSGAVIALMVSDNAIEEASAQLGAVAGCTVFHASGSRPSAVLAPLREAGAHTASWHPLAAIAARRGPDAPQQCAAMFRGASVGIEGEDAAIAPLTALAEALGAVPFRIDPAHKPAYHLAASLLAGYTVALADIAQQQWQGLGLPHTVSHDGLAHLVGTVAANLRAASSPAAALTGPISRGDATGLARQAARARELPPAAAALYRAHAEHLISIAARAERLTPQTAARLTQVLHDSFDAS
jgi:predicted short-subunit dehydrogenase-like oxidoreductase (DUF2520 family)